VEAGEQKPVPVIEQGPETNRRSEGRRPGRGIWAEKPGPRFAIPSSAASSALRVNSPNACHDDEAAA